MRKYDKQNKVWNIFVMCRKKTEDVWRWYQTTNWFIAVENQLCFGCWWKVRGFIENRYPHHLSIHLNTTTFTKLTIKMPSLASKIQEKVTTFLQYFQNQCITPVYYTTSILYTMKTAPRIKTTLCMRMNGTPRRIITATAQTNTINPKSSSKEAQFETRWALLSDDSWVDMSKKNPRHKMLKTATNETFCVNSLRLRWSLGYHIGIFCLVELSCNSEVFFSSLPNSCLK